MIFIHNIDRARFLPPTKIISWIIIGSNFELDGQQTINYHKFIGSLVPLPPFLLSCETSYHLKRINCI